MKHTSEEELFAYREGEMNGREAIAAHLHECPECRAELERLEEVFTTLNALPAPDPISTLFFSRVNPETASATAEFGTSRMTSTFSLSYQRRAILRPMSGLF